MIGRWRIPGRRARARARRGVTFLEVVLASLLLGLTTGAITSAFGLIERVGDRDRRRLEAAEVAHRAILQYLDDPTAMDKNGREVYRIGRGAYRILAYEEMLPEAGGGAENVSVRRKKVSAGADLMTLLQARILMVTVEVYEDVDGRRGTEPLSVMSRIFDPLNYTDDPEAMQKHIENLFRDQPELLEKFRNAAKQAKQGAAGSTPGASPGSGPTRINPTGPGGPGGPR